MKSKKPTSNDVRLNAALRWMLYLVLLGLWSSGVLWLVLHTFLQNTGEFGRTPHPLERPMLAAHGLFAFGALFFFGLLWSRHIQRAWVKGWRRPSGLFLLALAFVLIASGYLLYYAGGDETRRLTSILHWSLGLASPLFFAVHRNWK